MTGKKENQLHTFYTGLLYSYSQVFYSRNIALASILILVTFFDRVAGLSGVIAVLTANFAAQGLGFKKSYVQSGLYGFNALLVGLGLGMLYQPSPTFFFVLFFASLFTFFLTIFLEGFFGKYGLPYIGWPFLLAIWLVSLSTREFTALNISERGIFMINEMYRYGGINMVRLYFWANNLPLHESIITYFKSLAAIFFQYHLLAGVLVAIGLLIYSRIAFLLTIVGFFGAYFYYIIIGADLTQLSHTHIGFNYILSAIAIGGFFIVPSWASFLWVLLLTPVISFIMKSGVAFFGLMHLPVYSLPFNIVVLMFLYILKFRERNFYFPELVAVQLSSPELNLYAQKNYQKRFDVSAYIPMALPIMGEWAITQAHNGEHTHREDWRHAWDFEITDEEGSKFSGDGYFPKDYYCYGKPVVAPADGTVHEVIDGIPDNPIGQMNLANNWGNTIVIKHDEYLYSMLNHLAAGSIKTPKGTFVKKGEVLATVGNSGRSTVPHLHFQVQSTPFIGSKTIDYPIANYLMKQKDGFFLKNYDRPRKDEVVSNILRNQELFEAFNFTPGQTLNFNITGKESLQNSGSIEVKSDMYNYTYLECRKTGSKAYFTNNANMFYFTHFEGNKNSFLYYFYLGLYRVALGYYENMAIDDHYPLNAVKKDPLLYLHDFIAPFYMFIKATYSLRYISNEDDFTRSTITLEAQSTLSYGRKTRSNLQFGIVIENKKFKSIVITGKNFGIQASEISDKQL